MLWWSCKNNPENLTGRGGLETSHKGRPHNLKNILPYESLFHLPGNTKASLQRERFIKLPGN